MEDYYNYIKALHIIFVVCWFAGLFYTVRLFVYFAEGQKKTKEVQEILLPQYEIMLKRLFYIITYPSAVLTTIFGVGMIIVIPSFLLQGWMHLKLSFVILLWWYHIKCAEYIKQIKKGTFTKSGKYFRIWNEGATILLFAIVFLVVLKNSIGWIFGVLGIFSLAIILMLGFRFYEKKRKKRK